MSNDQYKNYKAVNEPIKSYDAGSDEKKTIKNQLIKMSQEIIEIPINSERLISLNHNCTISAVIIAKIIPFKIPIKNSLPTTRLKLLFDNSLVAIALIVTANVCNPALPPIESTIGIKTASATTFSISS